jgi:prolipoprotein diacylglyceryl transferase
MDALLAAFTYTPQQRWFDTVSPHGVGTALGFFLGAWLMAKRAEPRGIPRSEVYNAVTWGAIGAIIGARGFYVLGHLSTYTSIVDMLKVWEGGLTMFGGFIGGLVLGLGYLWRKKFDVLTAMDAAAPGFVVGVLIGRIGDILIADHLGQRTDFFLGYRVPNAPLAPGYGPPYYTPGVVVHHTAVYDFIGALVLLLFLRWLEKRRPRTGSLFAAFSIWYGLQRLFIDFTRNRAIIESSYFGLSGSQWAGLAFVVMGIFLLMRIRSRAEAAGDAAVPAPVTPSGQTVTAETAQVPPDVPPGWATPPAPVPPPSTPEQPPVTASPTPPAAPPPTDAPPPDASPRGGPVQSVPPPPVPVDGTPGASPARDEPVRPPPPPASAPVAMPEPSVYEPAAPPAPTPSEEPAASEPASPSEPAPSEPAGPPSSSGGSDTAGAPDERRDEPPSPSA